MEEVIKDYHGDKGDQTCPYKNENAQGSRPKTNDWCFRTHDGPPSDRLQTTANQLLKDVHIRHER